MGSDSDGISEHEEKRSRVVGELYIKSVSLALDDFLFFSFVSFSCREKQVTTLKEL
jgi:hypothetical protein